MFRTKSRAIRTWHSASLPSRRPSHLSGRTISRCGAGGSALAVVLQDGGDRGVGPGAEHQRAGAGGVNPFGAIALDQSQNADAGTETLLGMRPRAQDDIDQHGGVGADGLGLMADALVS